MVLGMSTLAIHASIHINWQSLIFINAPLNTTVLLGSHMRKSLLKSFVYPNSNYPV